MTYIKYLFLALAAFAAACAESFEEHYDLEVNSNKQTINADATSLPIMVYCSGPWTAKLVEAATWATLDRTSGSGITPIHLNSSVNTGLARSIQLLLSGAGIEKTITITQKAGITAPQLIFAEKDLAFANGNYELEVPFETNLPEELLAEMTPQVIYAEGDAWISEVAYEPTESSQEGQIPLSRFGLIRFKATPNTSDKTRTATVLFSTTDANGTAFGDQFTVTQSADEPQITLANDLAPIEGGERSVALSTNLTALHKQMTVEVSYKDPNVKDFVSQVVLGMESLSYTLTENVTVAKRFATITVSYTDLSGEVTSATTTITQRVTVQPREIQAEALRALFTAEDTPYLGDEDHLDYLVCRVIGDASNPNMDQNINTSANTITTDENDRTNYVQSLDGKYGFRLKFATKDDNRGTRFSKVKILLNGTTLSRESDPMRYTLRGLKAELIEKLEDGTASDLTTKQKTIARLTDDDLYTYCTLAGLEFSVKEGAYTNVREYDAILNPYNRNITFGNSQAQKAKDGAANLLYDGSNDAIYMLVNMNCIWRRSGATVPQGTGEVSGIIVHTPMERWGGNVGRYSIRPFDETDIAVTRANSSAFTTLAEWMLEKETKSIGQYKWNASGSYVVGDAANSAAQLCQNRMWATNRSDNSVVLYSENRMLNQVVTTDRNYPITLVHGYRGLNVSTYTTTATPIASNTPAFGMSKFTTIGINGNIAGWYDWNGTTWSGKTNGIVLEFPTTGVSGSTAAVSFSIAAGRHSDSEAYASWTNINSYPVYWKVEYATSTDNGKTWSSYTEAANAATGERGFEMRSLPWCINSSTYTSIFDTGNIAGVATQLDFGFGLVPYRFELPAEVFGKSKVKVRITPSSDVIAAWNAGANNYTRSQAYRGLRISKTYALNISSTVYLEDVSIQYK